MKELWPVEITCTSIRLRAASQTSRPPFMCVSIDIKALGFPVIPVRTFKANRLRSHKWGVGWAEERERSLHVRRRPADSFYKPPAFFISYRKGLTFST